MATKTCPHCGEERNLQGFNLHVKACKKKFIIQKEQQSTGLPGLDAQLEMFSSLEREKTHNQKLEVLNTPIESEDVECPSCHCIACNEIDYMEPCKTFRCTICGFAFQKNIVSGEYYYSL